ncbi:MAG: TetR/AcrR family transcriptional regulator C-terminal ligand-binding domain-containing protein [Phycicoccus sp.]
MTARQEAETELVGDLASDLTRMLTVASTALEGPGQRRWMAALLAAASSDDQVRTLLGDAWAERRAEALAILEPTLAAEDDQPSPEELDIVFDMLSGLASMRLLVRGEPMVDPSTAVHVVMSYLDSRRGDTG